MGRYEFKLPDVGEGVAQAEIVTWHVRPGDVVEEGAPFLDVMTDKATVEITSPVAGRVVSVAGETGGAAAVGSVVAVVEVQGAPESSAVEPASLPPETPAAAAPPSLPRGRPQAAPAVRRHARELGVVLERVRGTGAAGRITHADVETYASSEPRTAVGDGVELVRVEGLRRRIADKVAESKRRIPHFSYVEEVDVTALETLRARLNSEQPGRARVTVLPFVARALALAVADFPQINATYDDNAGVVSRQLAVHLGVATQTSGGLMVPVVRNAQALDLGDLAAEIARLAEAARAGRATREELSGSTLTVTSLGRLSGLVSTPVINWPEVAIVAPNRVVERPVVLPGGGIGVRSLMNLSSSFDHRVIDGWDAAAFIQRVKGLLERPEQLVKARAGAAGLW